MSERLEAGETRWRLVGKLRLCPGGWRRGRARLTVLSLMTKGMIKR